MGATASPSRHVTSCGACGESLAGPGEEAAVCPHGSRPPVLGSVAAHPPGTKLPLWLSSGVCGESDRLRRGPLGLMFNQLPPGQGTLAPAVLGAGGSCEADARQCPRPLPPPRKGQRGEGLQPAGRGVAGGTRPIASCRRVLPAAVCGFATDTPLVQAGAAGGGSASPVWKQEDPWPWAGAAGPTSSAHGLCTQVFVLSQAGAGLPFCRAGRDPNLPGPQVMGRR